MHHTLNHLIEHFGYFGIILALLGGIIGLPLPDEILLTYIGYNVFEGRLHYFPTLFSGIIGAICGISLSYLLGAKLGLPFLKRYGPKIHITEERIHLTTKLFNKLGPYLLVIGFFIPGIRHITAYLAAINSYSFRRFAFFAFLGAILWVFTFITIGRKLGPQWHIVAHLIARCSSLILPLIVLCSISLILYWRKKGV